MLGFLFRWWKKYEWFFNPHVDEHHEIALLMKDVGLKRSHWRVKKIHHVIVDNGRLIGIFYIELKKDLVETFLRLTVYQKEIESTDKPQYSLCYTFYHRTSKDDKFKVSSVAKTPYMDFDGIAKHIRSAQVIADARTTVYQIQQASKKVFVDAE